VGNFPLYDSRRSLTSAASGAASPMSCAVSSATASAGLNRPSASCAGSDRWSLDCAISVHNGHAVEWCDGRAHRVSGARQRSGGVEKYSSIASRQAPEHGSTAISPGPDSRISAAAFSAQLMQTPARSTPQPVQLQLDS